MHTNLDVAAIDGIGPNDWFEPVVDDSTTSFNCVAHSAQLAVMSDVFDVEIKAIVARVRRICTSFTKSPHKAGLLAAAQVAAGRPVLNVVRDVPTRWLSLHAMLERFVAVYEDILFLTLQGKLNPRGAAHDGDDEREIDDFISPTERVKLQRWVQVLRPVASFVNAVEGEKCVTLAAVPVLLLRCMRALDANAADDVDTRSLKRRLRAALDARLGFLLATPNLALAAAALHPAFGHLRFIDDATRAQLVGTLVDWALEFAETIADGGVVVHIDEQAKRTVLQMTFEALQRHFNANAPSRSVADPLHVPDADEAPLFDPLAFWKNARGAIAMVQHVARLVLCVPATSAPSERVFSGAGFSVNRNRSRLAEENVTMIATVRDHLSRLTDLTRAAFLERCAEKLKQAATATM